MESPPDNNYLRWIYILIFGVWGGLVRYIIDVRSGVIYRSKTSALAQIIISGFTGVIAGLFSESAGAGFHITLAISGISGAMGATALDYYWRRIIGSDNGKS